MAEQKDTDERKEPSVPLEDVVVREVPATSSEQGEVHGPTLEEMGIIETGERDYRPIKPAPTPLKEPQEQVLVDRGEYGVYVPKEQSGTITEGKSRRDFLFGWLRRDAATEPKKQRTLTGMLYNVATFPVRRRTFIKHAGAAAVGVCAGSSVFGSEYAERLFAGEEAREWADDRTVEYFGEEPAPRPETTITDKVLEGIALFAQDAALRTANTTYEQTIGRVVSGIDYVQTGLYMADLMFLERIARVRDNPDQLRDTGTIDNLTVSDAEVMRRRLRETLGERASTELVEACERRMVEHDENLNADIRERVGSAQTQIDNINNNRNPDGSDLSYAQRYQRFREGLHAYTERLVGEVLETLYSGLQERIGNYADTLGIHGKTTILFVTPGTVEEADVDRYGEAWSRLQRDDNVFVAHSEYKARIQREVREFTQWFCDFMREREVSEETVARMLPVDTSVETAVPGVRIDALQGPILTIREPARVHNLFPEDDMDIVEITTPRELVQSVYHIGGSEHTMPINIKFYSTTAAFSETILRQIKGDIERGEHVFFVPNEKLGEIGQYQERMTTETTPQDYLGMLIDLEARHVEEVLHVDNTMMGVRLARPTHVENGGMAYEGQEFVYRAAATSRTLRFINKESVPYETEGLRGILERNATMRERAQEARSSIENQLRENPGADIAQHRETLVQSLGSIADVYAVTDPRAAQAAMNDYDGTRPVEEHLRGKGITVEQLSLDSLAQYGEPAVTRLAGTLHEEPEHPRGDYFWGKLGAAVAAGVGVYVGIIGGIWGLKKTPQIIGKLIRKTTGV